ncbi:endothelial lipase [Scaptodrosophila lebanonensis]|uniref:Endothelial lipase n=1 Tax=Drosophila lebanonensis TaxID=7225 RepID=A0A6J2TJT0_DROLE|nr:endothelial lipase [Scaptodrosophila lebanonensis]
MGRLSSRESTKRAAHFTTAARPTIENNQLQFPSVRQRVGGVREGGGGGGIRPAEAQVKAPNEVESAVIEEQTKQVWEGLRLNGNEYDSDTDDTQKENTAKGSSSSSSSNTLMSPNMLPILERQNFGSSSSGNQNVLDEQLLRLQNYNLLYNAERQTYFQLHTYPMASLQGQSRVLPHVVSNTLSTAFGLNSNRVLDATDVKVENVQLYDAQSLRQTRFNPFNPTRILIHGWLGNAHANIYSTLLPVYSGRGGGNYNVFTVDWGRGAIADYITASYRVKSVGQVVAKFIDFLHREAGMGFEDLQLIGFSMGAHVAGIAGKHVQTGRVRIIRALDPASPFFRYAREGERVASGDADYVEVLHTSVGSYGFDLPLGHADFYANWGSQQPGCFWNECSHWRAFALFAESLGRPEGSSFVAQGCDASLWQELSHYRRCSNHTGRMLSMGGDLADASLETLAARRGVYYFQTNANAPYGQGGVGANIV